MKKIFICLITVLFSLTVVFSGIFGCFNESNSAADFVVKEDGTIIPGPGEQGGQGGNGGQGSQGESGGNSGSGESGGNTEPAPATPNGYTEGLAFNLLSNNTYSVGAGSAKNKSTVVIPKKYNGKIVSAFNENDKFTNLEKLYYTGTATEWSQIDGLTSLMGETDLYINEQKVSEIEISGVSEIKDCAFKGCESLTKVSLDSSVSKIGGGAFENCTSLTDFNLPSSVTDIRQKALRGVPSYSEYTDTTRSDMQYVVFVVTNVAYFDLESHVARMKQTHGANNPNSNRMYAFGAVGPFILNHTIETMRKQVDHCFELAEKYDIPVYFQMDDCKMYFTYSTGGTNYFGDEENCIHTGKLDGKQYKHFYEDPDMCEWVALPTAGQQWGGQQYGALPRWVMDWGPAENFNHVIGGYPCFNSPSYLEWFDNQVKEGFLYPLISNLIRLKQMGKEYLFAGVSTGWETMIPDYSADAVITKGTNWYYN
ncbi:MAG: leucine-rich repeat domain-containing protein, partial [Clostridia bacterium]|nr:leucine-rich repeat domain-containing protein [Clostridia bacterium]